MKALEIKQATAPLADYVRTVNKEPVIVSVKGKPVAALVSLENTDWETVSLSDDPQFLALIRHSRDRQEKEGGISSAELRHRLGINGDRRRAARERAPKTKSR